MPWVWVTDGWAPKVRAVPSSNLFGKRSIVGRLHQAPQEPVRHHFRGQIDLQILADALQTLAVPRQVVRRDPVLARVVLALQKAGLQHQEPFAVDLDLLANVAVQGLHWRHARHPVQLVHDAPADGDCPIKDVSERVVADPRRPERVEDDAMGRVVLRDVVRGQRRDGPPETVPRDVYLGRCAARVGLEGARDVLQHLGPQGLPCLVEPPVHLRLPADGKDVGTGLMG
mmetsp:Transcript_27693/g.44231  ORF Transcript_27693/g.44231 Transcript_27693/m.44231 type:complete len:228 (+) Transcript_27693:236-919(+)